MYAVYLHVGALEAAPVNKAQRRKVMDFIRSLQRNPFVEGDYVDHDSAGRLRQIKIVGNHAVTYWADNVAKIVMIVDLCPAG